MAKKSKKNKVTKRDEEQARKVIKGICFGLIILMLIILFVIVLQ
jgi:hypothetical protein